MNILSVFVLFAIVLKCVVASEEDVGVGFKEAVDRENVGWLKENWGRWYKRNDLLDDVIAKGADVTAWFIQNIRRAKWRVFAALFDKGENGMIEDVLEKVEYSDEDLTDLTGYRPELVGSPEKVFRIFAKIKEPRKQEFAVRMGARSLLATERHDLVVPFVHALGKGTFKSKRLEEEAIQEAFSVGALRDKQDIVGLYCEHPAITSRRYASGLANSWNDGKPNQVFRFLVEQADQGDLDMAKRQNEYKKYPKFRQAIDKAFKAALPAGSRHLRPIERAQHALAVFASIIKASDEYGPGSILASYLVGEEIWARKSRR